jgi:hypothetical protein
MITAISTNAAVVGGRPYSDGQRRVALNANPEPIETERDRLKATAIDRGVVWCGAAESLSNGASPSCPCRRIIDASDIRYVEHPS